MVIAALLGHVESVVRRLGVEIQANLTTATPKDTNWAAANWIGSIGAPVRTPDGQDGTRGVKGSATTTGMAAASAAVLATWRIGMGNVYVSNHVPYIRALDGGSSAQAPAGFTRASILRAMDTVRYGATRGS